MGKRKFLLIIIAVITCGLILCGLCWKVVFTNDYYRDAEKKMNQYLANNSFNLNTVLNREDSILFKTEQLQYMTPKIVTESKIRNNVRSMDYKKIGSIFYTSLDLKQDIPLDSLVSFQNTITPIADGFSIYAIHIRPLEVGLIDSIICCYQGKQDVLYTSVISNNFRSYYLDALTFGIKYGVDEPIDMSFMGKMRNNVYQEPRPLAFAFYKINTKVFFVAFIPYENEANEEDVFDRDFLSKIIKYD